MPRYPMIGKEIVKSLSRCFDNLHRASHFYDGPWHVGTELWICNKDEGKDIPEERGP